MIRSTVRDARLSMLPQAIGAKTDDIPKVCAFINRAQQTLINAGGETGWVGGWQKVVFQVSRCNPYITLPREFSRIINLAACRIGLRIQNEFYEFLEAGVGLQGFNKCKDWCGAMSGYERGVWPTMRDLDTTNQLLRVYLTDVRDVGMRVLVGPCKDGNGNPIYSQDGVNSVNGFYLTLAQPFATSTSIVTEIGGIQKDITYGDVLLYQVDATTGAEVLLSRYAATETNPAYRRYYINQLPCNCAPVLPTSPCTNPAPIATTVAVTAIAKLEFIPATRDTDFLIIGNIPALIEECKAIRYSDQDAPESAAMEAKCHAKAIKMLNDELRSFIGETNIAVNLAPFGTASLSRPMAAVRFG